SGVSFFRLSLSSSGGGSFCFILSIYTFFCFCQSPDLNPYDKGYSLTDCASMQIMRQLEIYEILTFDKHFQQEGFSALLRE
ncbi:MAG: hypothetical protein EWV53_08380, partial [Microcystis panniformis Mp_MB_F_20051200_S9]